MGAHRGGARYRKCSDLASDQHLWFGGEDFVGPDELERTVGCPQRDTRHFCLLAYCRALWLI